MNFATLGYVVFLLIIVAGYWLMPRTWGRYWLVAASLVFYGSWNPAYVPGFAVLIVANWALGLMAVARPRPAVLLGVGINLSVLAFFKYADWVLGSSANLLERITGEAPGFSPLGIILPLAISFVTFTMLAYVIDTARGSRPERHLGRFALFVTFFPHLIAGPIMRGYEFLPQVRHPRPFRRTYLVAALPLLVGGLFKKTLGDNLAPVVESLFADPTGFSSVAIWIGVTAFAFQIYFDFSGYTDLALGSAQLLGFRLPRNFDWPYRSLSIQEFWRRWHMTLSRWLRDYLYIPLGGSRHGPARNYLALFTTMLLGGLWHGAGLTFVIWGGWHGVGLAVHRWWRRRGGGALPPPAAWGVTFLFVLIGWIFFRAESVSDAMTLLTRAISLTDGAELPAWTAVAIVAFVVGQWPGWTDLLREALPQGSYRRYAAQGAVLAFTVLILPVDATEFIYFQF